MKIGSREFYPDENPHELMDKVAALTIRVAGIKIIRQEHHQNIYKPTHIFSPATLIGFGLLKGHHHIFPYGALRIATVRDEINGQILHFMNASAAQGQRNKDGSGVERWIRYFDGKYVDKMSGRLFWEPFKHQE